MALLTPERKVIFWNRPKTDLCCLNSKKISITLRTRQLPFVSTSTLSGQHYESIWAIHSLRKSKKHPKTYFKWIKAQQGKQNRLMCRIELWWKRRVEIRNTLLLKTGKNLKTKTEDIAKEFFKKKHPEIMLNIEVNNRSTVFNIRVQLSEC